MRAAPHGIDRLRSTVPDRGVRVSHHADKARAVWFAVTAAVNSGLIAWLAGHGGVGSRAVEWSLATFCIAVAARHDGIVRGAFVLGRQIRSYRLHQLTYHLGQLHRAMAIAGMAWLAAAAAVAVPSSRAAGMASAGVLAILVVMARTARDRVRHSRHNRFESVHRLGGGAALGILAVIVPIQAARSLPPGSSLAGLLRAPSMLLLAALVVLVAHPWLGVRRRDRAPVRGRVRGQQRRRARQRCPGVPGAGRGTARPSTHRPRAPRVPASSCRCAATRASGESLSIPGLRAPSVLLRS